MKVGNLGNVFLLVLFIVACTNIEQLSGNPAIRNSPLFAALRLREFRICKSPLFSFLLRVVCQERNSPLFHRSKRSTPGPEQSNFIQEKTAKTFITKTKRSTHDQSYVDECCGHSKYGCNLNEIYEYCNYV